MRHNVANTTTNQISLYYNINIKVFPIIDLIINHVKVLKSTKNYKRRKGQTIFIERHLTMLIQLHIKNH